MAKKYTSGEISHSFWQKEFSIAVKLHLQGKTPEEMRRLSIEENVYNQPTERRKVSVAQVMNKRIMHSNDKLLTIFNDLSNDNQRLVNLCAIMATNQLLHDFVIEDFRNEIILGDATIENREWLKFFRRKDIESNDIANWSDETKNRMSRLIKTYVREAGLTKYEDQVDKIQFHLLDFKLVDTLNEIGHSNYIAAFTGV
ncbi:BrxA family protein [Periweissella fabalis]|uniref:DUF1819 family protein n=1 Tax=Periweissella fabalis TaxID=1070421 RepID=A0A7X6N3V7_9LACO|nr:BrxA family protein [Periweissella fabalis]MCM0599114.1 DUF1819 family protein [Periweissella fabalis]NKZ23393.1 DUF1819 family protein [Periweissella fabalis]